MRSPTLDCDFRRADAYTYTVEESQVHRIQAEVDAAAQLGLPATFTQTTDLPFPVQGAIKLTGQAMFHPRKFCLALAERIPGRRKPPVRDDASHGCHR